MNFLSKLLLPKVAGTIGAFMLAAVLALSVSVYTKSQRIESLSAQLKSCKDEKALVLAAANNLSSSNIQKDEIIRKQTMSIKSLKAKSDADALAYQARLDTARSTGRRYKDEAASLLKLDAGTTEELGLCRAARGLLEKELIND